MKITSVRARLSCLIFPFFYKALISYMSKISLTPLFEKSSDKLVLSYMSSDIYWIRENGGVIPEPAAIITI